MACIALPAASRPSLGGGISVDPPGLSTPAVDARFCCKLPLLPPLDVIPDYDAIGLPIADVLAVLDPAIDTINAWRRSLPLDCPKEFK